MKLINSICRKGTEPGVHFHVKELQKSMVSDIANDCLENFLISNAKEEDLILKFREITCQCTWNSVKLCSNF